MIRTIFFTILLFLQGALIAQNVRIKWPFSWYQGTVSYGVADTFIADTNHIKQLIAMGDKGIAYPIASKISIPQPLTAFEKNQKNNGTSYLKKMVLPNAQGAVLFFKKVTLSPNDKIWVYNEAKTFLLGPYTHEDVTAEGLLTTEMIKGSEFIVEIETGASSLSPNLEMDFIHYVFRSIKSSTDFGGAEVCMINANCSESSNYKESLSSVCRIYVVGTNFGAWCTGNLMNNTRQDRTPYVLTANHCSVKSSLADFSLWTFYFNYEASGCVNPVIEPLYNSFKGATVIAQSSLTGSDTTSDFLLMKLLKNIPTTFPINYLGWDASGVPSLHGACFHHANGDIKKISTYSSPTKSSTYSGQRADTHWEIKWSATPNGYSVTQGGSSGSGLLNEKGMLIGTLTGGGSTCVMKTEPDFYGKFYHHWDRNGTTPSERLKDWLDPIGVNLKSAPSLKYNENPGPMAATSLIKSNSYFRSTIIDHQLTIYTNSTSYTMELYNALGQMICKKEKLKNQQTFDISEYITDGIILKLFENDSEPFITKIMQIN